jgi:hypothetical protein
MRPAEHLFEIGLAHIFPVIGLVASLFVWRAKDVGKTVGRVREAWNAHSAGVSLVGRHERNTWFSLSQLGLWTFTLGACVLLTTYLFIFLSLMATLYQVADSADVTLLEILGRRADSLRHKIVISGLVISGLLAFEWIVGLGVDATAVKDGPEEPAHLFNIPREWCDAPAEMWRQRHSAASPEDKTVGDEWLEEWSAWIEIVGAVRDAGEKP